jgi:hypothetical protein
MRKVIVPSLYRSSEFEQTEMTISFPLPSPSRTPPRRGKGRLAHAVALQAWIDAHEAQTYPMAPGKPQCLSQESRSSSDPHDGQMLGVFELRDGQSQPASDWLASGHLRSRAFCFRWIAGTRLQPRTAVGWSAMMQDLGGSRAVQVRMRTLEVIPSKQAQHLGAHRQQPQRHEDGSQPFLLDRANEAFGDRDAPVLPYGPESGPDASPSAPLTELLSELHPAVGNRVPGCGTNATDCAVESSADLLRRGLSVEQSEANREARELVDDDERPPTEGPAQPAREALCSDADRKRRPNNGQTLRRGDD